MSLSPSVFLLPDAEKDALESAVHRRFSCRAFGPELPDADWGLLSYLAASCELPGVRLLLFHADDALFSGVIPVLGPVTGCTTAAAVVVRASLMHPWEAAGFSMEHFWLSLVAQEYAAVFLTGSFRRDLLALPISSTERLMGLMAIGTPAVSQPARIRKPLEVLCKGSLSEWPEDCRAAAELVQEAPSAMNLQPWLMSMAGSRFLLDSSDRTRFDLGAAMCHAEIALRRPHRWALGLGRMDSMSSVEFYS